ANFTLSLKNCHASTWGVVSPRSQLSGSRHTSAAGKVNQPTPSSTAPAGRFRAAKPRLGLRPKTSSEFSVPTLPCHSMLSSDVSSASLSCAERAGEVHTTSTASPTARRRAGREGPRQSVTTRQGSEGALGSVGATLVSSYTESIPTPELPRV